MGSPEQVSADHHHPFTITLAGDVQWKHAKMMVACEPEMTLISGYLGLAATSNPRLNRPKLGDGWEQAGVSVKAELTRESQLEQI